VLPTDGAPLTYMSPATTTPAGWYVDPADASMRRWWDGVRWTSYSQPAPTDATPAAHVQTPAPFSNTSYGPQHQGSTPGPLFAAPVSAYPPAASQPPTTPPLYRAKKKRGLYNAEVDLANGKNSPATNAIAMGIICLLANPFALISIAAIVWAGIGLTRANMYENRGNPPIGRKKSAWGMGLGIIGFLATLVLKGFMF
jgi:Protein of unknown function (DUF2510)